MEAERLVDYEHEKQRERKRRGAHLEAIFEQNAKKSTQDTNDNNIIDRMINKYSENGTLASASSSEIVAHNAKLENAGKPSARSRNPSGSAESSLGNPKNAFGDTGKRMGNPRSPSGNSGNSLRNTRISIGNTGSRMEHARNSSEISRSPIGKATNSIENASRNVSYPNGHDSSCAARERLGSDLGSPERQNEPSISEGHHYSGFKKIQSSSLDPSAAKEKQSKGSEFQNAVTIKQEKTDDSPPVQDMSLQSHVPREKSSSDNHGEIGDECLKFLLFSGKLYHCERVSDLTHSFSKFIGDNVLGRKGKVVVLLLFHKTLREVLNYVVGVVDHYTLEEHNIIIKIIKHHTYPTTTIPTKEVGKGASKLVAGSKKLLYNLQPLHGPVYGELVKILDGFGANSAVDHAKISEFNAMVNANADRMDGQISNILGGVGYPYRGTLANRNFVPPSYSYIGSRFPQSNPRYSPQANQPSPYSPEKSHGASAYDRSKSVDGEIQNGYQRRANTSYYREGHHVNTVSANQTVRITPQIANSTVDHIRASSAVPITSNSRFRSTEDGSLSSQRHSGNVEDLQTVAELCKEKMKRDMAEQELKSIRAAFEEFKSQMQQHLSQVEERMVLLEAENRTLKGKLSNMHQNNGFAEKKYHELRSQLEDLLKST